MKFSIKIGLHVKRVANETEEVPIRLRVSWSSNRVDIRSGYVVAPAKWDEDNSCVRLGAKNSHKQSSGEINRALINLSAKVEEVLVRFEMENKRSPTATEFKMAFNEAVGRAKPKEETEATNVKGFCNVLDIFTKERGATNNWSKATYSKFASIKQHLLKFNPSLSLSDFSKADFTAFVSYLQTQENQLNTTVAKNVGFLRWFLRWAVSNGYYNGVAHLQCHPRFKGLDCKEVIYLSWEELQHFLNFKFPKNRTSLPPVRDVFCFCCFTGLRYSDVARLRVSDVKREAKPPYISIVTKKTTARLHIELNKYALSILDKYKDIGLPNGKALPVISNAKMNEYLHEAAEIAGLDEPIRVVSYHGSVRTEKTVEKYALLTTHAGRRTFIVNALRLGIPAPVIMEWTGHSNYKAMKPYIKIVDAAKAENMDKFNSYGEDEK